MTEHSMFSRLEDFISLADKGEEIGLTVTLNKQIFTRKFDPYTMGDPEDEIDMYILSANYVFVVKGKTNEIKKFYVSGIEGESLDTTKRNIYIANERVRMDYRRLSEAKIAFEEKYWDEKVRGSY
jgi:hypothetical protein